MSADDIENHYAKNSKALIATGNVIHGCYFQTSAYNRRMRISLTRALIGLVERELQGTEAQTASETVRDGVRLLKDRSARRDFVLSRIRKGFEATLREDEPRQAAPANVKKVPTGNTDKPQR